MRRFWEKPSREIARELMVRGCLWNSFVIVGRLTTLLGLFLMTQPQLYLSFSGTKPALGTTFEQETVRRVYDHLPPADFSRDVLQLAAVNLGVLPVANMGWNDLGDPVRLNQVRARLGGTDSALNSSGSHLKEARNNG